MPTDPQPPSARVSPTQRTHHGDTFVDDYAWLKDRDDPATIAYLEAENAYTEARTAHLAELSEAIFTEIKARTEETDLSVPVRRGQWWYYSRSFEGKQYSVSCRCPVAGSDDWDPPRLEAGVDVPGEQVLLDSNELAEGHDFFSLGSAAVSPDGNLLAFGTDTVGDERFLLQVKDLRTGELMPDQVPGTLGAPVWDRAGTVVFYSTVDDAWRRDKVWRHVLGTAVEEDVVVHHERDERYSTWIGRTRSDKFLFLGCRSNTTSEYALLDAGDPLGEFRVVAPRRAGVDYDLEHAVIGGEDRLLVLHNDGALDYELAVAPVDASSAGQWEPVVAHDPGVRLEDVQAFATHLVLSQRSEGQTRLRVVQLTEQGLGEDRQLEFDDAVYTVVAGDNPEFGQPRVRFGFTSFTTPGSVYDYDVASAEMTLLKQEPVLAAPEFGPYDAGRYEQHRDWATAPDGTRVPISIVVPKGVPRDGSTPMVLYGYGAYEHSIDPRFSIDRLCLLDRGIGYAIAHVRGGGEMGRSWYDNGKMLHKTNTFTDFVACARHLADTGWTSADRLAAMGGSAGGLLMGAVANMAPDAFAAIVAIVPFVDALTTILDPSLPLTVTEWEEWGNPLDDAEAYAYMKSYTPYENVKSQRYPAILAETSLHDTRVFYVEPAKWIARLRATAVDSADLLLKTRMAAGHGGVSGRYTAWHDQAFRLAWLVDRLTGSWDQRPA